jgi:predicted O-methyltransferase YrrM
MIIYRNQLGHLLNTLKFTKAAEIGVQKGLFSKIILSEWPNGHLTLVDSWEHVPNDSYHDVANVSDEEHLNNMKITEQNVSQYTDRYTMIKGYSNQVYANFEDNYFDLVYLDANHKYENVYEDISLWINKVKNGGFLCGHDYVDGNLYEGNFGVKSAVKDFFKRDPDFITQEPWPSWFVRIIK